MFYRFFAACQARKYCNLQCFCAFGMKKILLHAENYVNTRVFARSGPKNIVNTVILATRGRKHCKYRGFGLPRRPEHRYFRCFLLRECQKMRKRHLFDDFSGLTKMQKYDVLQEQQEQEQQQQQQQQEQEQEQEQERI